MGHRTTKANHKVKVHKTVSCRIDFFYYAFRNVLLVSVPLLFFSIFVFTIPHSSAEISSGADNIQLVLSTSCTVNAVVTSEHTVSLNGGQLDNNVGNTKLSAYCNVNNGYSIYAVGSSNNIDGNTDLIYNNGLSDSYNIRTGVYNDTIQTNPSSWAMKLTAGTGTGIDPVTGESVPTTPPTIINGYDSYSAIPNVYTQVAKRTSGTSMTTDTSVSGSYLDTTYQIYANSAQPAGTYNGKVKYVIVHPNSNHNTIPDLDTAFAAAGKMKVYEEGGNSYYAMQDINSQICSLVGNSGEVTATQLVDLRDSKLYWVAKLADGHCWMTQNLDFDIAANTTLNSNTTDLNVIYDNGQYQEYADGYAENNDIIYWTPASTATTINHVISGTSVTNWENQATLPYSVEGGDIYYYTSNSSSDDTTFNSLTECVTNGRTEAECKHYHRGNYYNWTAAIASNASGGISDNYANAANSICPKNWKLPTATNNNQSAYKFGELLYTYYDITQAKYNEGDITGSVPYTNDGFKNIRKAPLGFVRSGNISNSTLYNIAADGRYWSSTVSDNDNAYGFYFSRSGVWPSYSRYRYGGWSVRCIAR